MTLVKRNTKGAPLTHSEMDANWDHCLDMANMSEGTTKKIFTSTERTTLTNTRNEDQVKFLTSDQDQSFDVSNASNYCVFRTGANWTAERTITFNGVPPSRGRIVISNNSGYHIYLDNGTDSPLDVPLMPFRIPRHEYVELVVNPTTLKLIKVSRGAEVSSSTIVPDGGLKNNALLKLSDDDFHFGWTRIVPIQRSWLTNVSGLLDSAIHSGRGLSITGNVTIPTDQGFRCILRSGGAYTVTFNGTTSAAMASGDIMKIEVPSSSVIVAKLTAAASLVAFT